MWVNSDCRFQSLGQRVQTHDCDLLRFERLIQQHFSIEHAPWWLLDFNITRMTGIRHPTCRDMGAMVLLNRTCDLIFASESLNSLPISIPLTKHGTLLVPRLYKADMV